MIKFRIISDSSCGITQKEANELGVKVLPLILSYNGKEYRDGVDVSSEEFYDMVFSDSKSGLPKTSQVSPGAFVKCYEEILADGEIPIVLPISSVLSGTYQAALIAKSMLPGNDIYVVDSQSALGSVKVMIKHLVSQTFETIEELMNKIEYLKEHLNFLSVPCELEYLYKGGRLSKTSKIIGDVLHIKPVIQLDEKGKLCSIEKARGLKGAFRKILEKIKEYPIDPAYPFELGYSTNVENVNLLKEVCQEELPYDVTPHTVSPAVGIHVGPGASAIFYVSNKVIDK